MTAREAIEFAINATPFESASLGYCKAVRDVIREKLPNARSIDVFHRITEIVVDVRGDDSYALVVPLV